MAIEHPGIPGKPIGPTPPEADGVKRETKKKPEVSRRGFLKMGVAAGLAAIIYGAYKKNWVNFSSEDTELSAAPGDIPEFPPSIPSEYITAENTGKTPQQLAKEAGYDILWIAPGDDTGRTVFYDSRPPYGKGGIGTVTAETTGTDGKTYRFYQYIIGSFVKFEDILGSSDKYIILKDPKTSELLPRVRVAFANEISTTAGLRPTGLFVENLSFQQDPSNNDLGYISQWGADVLGKIFQSGDAVSISLTYIQGVSKVTRLEEGNTITQVLEPPCAGGIGIRRFGGKAQIEKELGVSK